MVAATHRLQPEITVNWLNKFRESFQPKAVPGLALGAFGKHPGWNDHLEDLGLDTEALLATRQLLYVQGIGGLIESGGWNNADPSDPIPEFAHVFFWFSAPDFVAGRLWASHDGKGRDRYPMVICAHAAHLPPALAADSIALALEKLQAACRSATSAEQVRAAVYATRDRLRSELLTYSIPPALPTLRRAVAERMGLSPGNDNANRVWYALQGQLVAYASAKITEEQRRLGPKIGSFPILPQQIRLPADPTDIVNDILFWREFVTTLVGKRIPILFIHPLGSPWVDLIVGSPTPKQLYCIKASPKSIPPVTEIPYNLPEETRERATREFEAFITSDLSPTMTFTRS